jgi:TPR repeat protein
MDHSKEISQKLPPSRPNQTNWNSPSQETGKDVSDNGSDIQHPGVSPGVTVGKRELTDVRTEQNRRAQLRSRSVSGDDVQNEDPMARRKRAFEKASMLYKAKAEQGDAKAQCEYGWMLIWCGRSYKDKEPGVKYLKKSADQGYARAQGRVGFLYMFGNAVICLLPIKNKAIEFAQKGAAGGDACSQRFLEIITSRWDNPQHREEAIKLFKVNSIDQDDTDEVSEGQAKINSIDQDDANDVSEGQATDWRASWDMLSWDSPDVRPFGAY